MPSSPSRWWRATALVAAGVLFGGGVAYAVGPRRIAAPGTIGRVTSPAPRAPGGAATTTTVAATTTTVAPTTTTVAPTTTTTGAPAPTTTTTAPLLPPPEAPLTPAMPTTAAPGPGAQRADQDHPCAALTAAEVEAATLSSGITPGTAAGRCRYRTAKGTDRVVVTVSEYPSAGSARNGLRDDRKALALTDAPKCEVVDVGDEAVVCRPTTGPVAAVGLVRVGTVVLRLDLLGSPPSGSAALLLCRAATRL